MRIHPFDPSKTVSWANGTSTELFVYPADGNFQTRDFTFRISTATVEAEETTLSDFSGLTRILLPLKGKLTLVHEGRYTIVLDPFEQDQFDGAWNTRSKGKVQDFNVIFNKETSARVLHHHLTSGETKLLFEHESWHFIFVNDGIFEVNGVYVSASDFIEFERSNAQPVQIKCIEAGNLLECIIR
ncbi:MAG: HutD family protein [Cryomorphaceae bacterium]|nr:HutD family protein [Cryomorphaceae bacterium]